MRFKTIGALLSLALLTAGLACAKDSPDQEREKIRKTAAATLTDLYKLQPEARTAIQNSAGYAVFDNLGTNLLLLSMARAAGVAVNSKTFPSLLFLQCNSRDDCFRRQACKLAISRDRIDCCRNVHGADLAGFSLLRPTPPRSVTMATDPQGSFTAELAKQYAVSSAKRDRAQAGPDSRCGRQPDSAARPSQTSALALLSGITTQRDSPDLLSLGTLFYERCGFLCIIDGG
jgi:hypothetical protein